MPPSTPAQNATRPQRRTLRWAACCLVLLLTWSLPVLAAPVWLPRADASALRVLSWNVSRERLFADPALSGKVLGSINADVLLLDEMPATATEARIHALLATMPLPADSAEWHVVLGKIGGNRERASISSRWPLQRIAAFDALHYPEDDVRQWLRAANGRPADLAQKLALGIAAVGALLQREDRRILLLSLDLQCCGETRTAWEERRRQREAQILRSALESAVIAHRIDTVIVGGDFNTVQGDAPLRILAQSPREPALQIVAAQRRWQDADWTWDGRGTPYPSRRMDYLLHSVDLAVIDSALFDSEELPPPLLDALGLDPMSSPALSPHRPVVADFRWPPP